MNAKAWKSIATPIAAAYPEFGPMRKGLVRTHPWVAECLFAASSSSKEYFYLEAFAFPLFVPSEHLYFSFGSRIGSMWELADVQATDAAELIAAIRAALPGLRARATLSGLTKATRRWQIDPYMAEIRLCIALLNDRPDDFDSVARALQNWKIEDEWEEPTVARCLELVDVVKRRGASAGLEELSKRRDDLMVLLR